MLGLNFFLNWLKIKIWSKKGNKLLKVIVKKYKKNISKFIEKNRKLVFAWDPFFYTILNISKTFELLKKELMNKIIISRNK